MRIVILCLSPSRGGLELYALDEIRELIKRGHECFAVVAKNSYLHDTLQSESIAHAILDVKFKRLPLFAARKLKSLVRDFDPDVLHFHWSEDLYLAVLFKAMVGGQMKLVHTRHMNYTRSKKDIFHRWFYKKIDLLLTGTNLLLELAHQYLPIDKDKIKCLYLGAAIPDSAPADCQLLFDNTQFKKRRLNIAVFGRIEEGKGQHVLVEAIHKILQDGKDISLTMIGHTMDKSYQATLRENISNKGLNDFIRFKGFLKNATAYMPCFDVIVLSTHCETFGLVLIEAMRAGVAVVGTNAGGVPEIIEDNMSGCLVEPRNSNSMRLVIEKLYTEPEFRSNIAQAGQHRADSLFANEVHYPQLEKLLKDALKL